MQTSPTNTWNPRNKIKKIKLGRHEIRSEKLRMTSGEETFPAFLPLNTICLFLSLRYYREGEAMAEEKGGDKIRRQVMTGMRVDLLLLFGI